MSDILSQFDEADKSIPYAYSPVKQGSVLDQFDAADKATTTNVTKSTASYNPTGSNYENFAAGAGKAIVDLGRGAKQLIDPAAKWLESKFPGLSAWSQSVGFPSAKQSAEKTNADVAESRALDAPLMDTKAGIAGNIAGSIAGTMLPLGVAAKSGSIASGAAKTLLNPTTYKAAAAAGALQGALVPTIEGESKTGNAAVGAGFGILGNAITNGIGRLAQPVNNILSSAQQKAVDTLQRYGVPLDAAQRSGSVFLSRVKSGLSDNPFTAGAQSDMAATQKAAYNRAVLSTIGEDAGAATADVMGRADQRIGGVFKDILDRNNVKVDDNTLSRIAAIQSAAHEEEKAPVVSIANRFINAVKDDGSVPGQAAYNIKKDLDRYASSSDSSLAYHARNLRSAVMDAIGNSLDEADSAAFSQARNQFSNMKKIEQAVAKDGTGDISPQRLANVMAQKANRSNSVYGRGDQKLVDLAHAGNMLLPDKLPNSGSVARGVIQIAAPLAVGGAQGAYTGDWENAAKTALALYAAPKAAQFLLNNPTSADYIATGMRGSMMPIRNLLEAPQTIPMVGGALRRLPGAARTATKSEN